MDTQGSTARSTAAPTPSSCRQPVRSATERTSAREASTIHPSSARSFSAVAMLWAGQPAQPQPRRPPRYKPRLNTQRLGQRTTIGFAFQIAAPPGEIPPPLTSVEVSLPGRDWVRPERTRSRTMPSRDTPSGRPKRNAHQIAHGIGTALAESHWPPNHKRDRAHHYRRTIQHSGRLALLIYAVGELRWTLRNRFPGAGASRQSTVRRQT